MDVTSAGGGWHEATDTILTRYQEATRELWSTGADLSAYRLYRQSSPATGQQAS